MEQKKADPAESKTPPTDGGDIAKNVKRTLGLDDAAPKELDDEMQRPPDDRSPLT